MSREDLLEACVAYIKMHAVLVRALEGFREKYASYGRFAGAVTLTNVTVEERSVLEGFFQCNYHGKTQVKINADQFEKALSQSRFAGLDGESVLYAFYGTPLLSKKAQKEQYEAHWSQLIAQTQTLAETTLAKQWLQMLDRTETTTPAERAMQRYLKKRDRAAGGTLEEAKRLFILGVQILNRLPLTEPMYLPVFAAALTGDPHAFDNGQSDGGFLSLLVRWLCHEAPMNNVLEKQQAYLRVGLLLDDLSNYVMALGLRAWKRNGQEHPGMAGFFTEKEPIQLPLADIIRWQKVRCPNDRLYMVENPSVYAVLCTNWQGKQALVCGGGQPSLSVYELLDLLVAGTEVWYAGDLDPEGLQIAERLARYYDGPFHYWHMSVEDYYKSLPSKAIDEPRLKKLDKIVDPRLDELVAAIQRKGTAGYQENLLQCYIDDILS